MNQEARFKRELPPLDQMIPSHLETATFSLG